MPHEKKAPYRNTVNPYVPPLQVILVIARACEKISMTVFLELPTKKKNRKHIYYNYIANKKNTSNGLESE